MSNDIKSTIIVLAAVVFVSILLRLAGLHRKSSTFELSWWMVITVAGFMIGNLYVLMSIIVALKLFYLRSDLDRNMFFFLFLLPAIYLPIQIPFPHPNFPLLDMTQLRILSLIILVPLLPKLFAAMRHNQSRRILFDIPLLYIFGREIAHEFLPNYYYESTSITSIKGTMVFVLEVIVPYIALAAWIDRDRRLLLAFRACLIGGLILAIVGIIGAFIRWDIYREMSFVNMNYIDIFYDARGGFLRIGTSLEHPITFAFYLTMILGMVLGWLYWRKSNLVKIGLIVIPILAAIFFTGSRGGWVGAAMLLLAFYYFKMPKHTRLLTFTVLLVSGLLISGVYMQSNISNPRGNVAEVDPYGTFEYRKRLFYAELAILPKRPYFGNSLYMQEPEMQAMVQGQGIIDPVNTYMTFAVSKGLIFLGAILLLLMRSLKAATHYIESGYINNKRIRVMLGAGLAALLVASMAELIFTSFSGPIIIYFWIMLGIFRGVYFITKKNDEHDFSIDDMKQPGG